MSFCGCKWELHLPDGIVGLAITKMPNRKSVGIYLVNNNVYIALAYFRSELDATAFMYWMDLALRAPKSSLSDKDANSLINKLSEILKRTRSSKAERAAHNRGVAGSTPAGSTTES